MYCICFDIEYEIFPSAEFILSIYTFYKIIYNIFAIIIT